MASAISGESSPPSPSWPVSARRSAFARPRVEWRSSWVTRNEGHITSGCDFRHAPLLSQRSTAPSRLPCWDQSSTTGSSRPAYPGRYRNSERSSMRGGSTILPGFMIPWGSNVRFTSANADAMRSPSMERRNSERSRPSPCSPECVPCSSRTTSCVASAIVRTSATSSGSFRLSAGRTCRQPTEACAYHVPSAPFFAKISSTRRAYSARCSSGTAQSSMNEMGRLGPAIDMTMLRPAWA